MDFRLLSDRTMCVAGPSQSGKTHFIIQLLEQRNELFKTPIKSVKWCYGIHNMSLQNLLRSKGFDVFHGIPNEEDLEPNSICVLDDLIGESENSKQVTNMFTKVAHHLPCFIIFVSQNLFPNGKESRTRSLNTHYYVIFKNPRDKLQFQILARQMVPNNSKLLVDIFQDATQRSHGYLLIDLTQECPDKFRFRANILDTPMYIYKIF